MAEVDLATLAVRVRSEGVEQTAQQLGDLSDEAGKAETQSDRLSESTSRLVAKYVSLLAIAGTVAQSLRYSIGQYTELNRATADLSAKTGLAGEALGLLVQRSKELAQSSTQSAVAILDAAEQVEGMLPALEGNAEAIAEVTRQAVILAEANGDELEPSVQAVTLAMLQFGGGAAEAARYANALVQASSVGAAGVQDLSAAMDRVGPSASRAGLSFEQTLGAMELLANRGIRGREAVGGLKEFLDRLATTTEERYSPAIVGLDKALENLAAENLTAAQRVKLFGESAADVAAVVISSRTEFAGLTEQITGTNAAAEQAAIRMETLEARAAMLKNQVQLLGAEVGERLNPYLIDLYDALGDSAGAFLKVLEMEAKTQEQSESLGNVIRSLTLWAISLTNALGAVIGTAQKVTEAFFALFDGINQGTANTRTNLGGIFREWQAEMEQMADRVTAARDRLFDPESQPSALTAPPPAGATSGDADAAANAAREAEERAAAARREAAAAALEEARAAEVKRLEFVQQFADRTGEYLADSTAEQIDAQIEANHAKYQAEVDLANRIEEFRAERQELLAERIKEWSETDLERTLKEYQRREDAINEFFGNVTFPAEEERQERLRQLYEQKEADITEIFRRGAFTRAQFAVASTKNQTVGVLAELENMTRGIAQHSKAAFNVNKAAAIAQAVIAMPEHVSKTMAKYPFPLSVAMGALAAAASLAQINAIRSATFEGGGGGTTPSLAGSGGVVNGNPAVPDAAPTTDVGSARGQGSQIVIAVTGNQVFDDYALDRLVDRIGDIVNDGDRTIFRGDSRQAQDIVVTTR